MQTDINARLTGVERSVQDIRLRADASNHNTTAYTTNAIVRRPDHSLTEFHDVATNALIPNFPATGGDISTLSTAELNGILRALGLAQTGTVRVKQDRLKTKIGLPTF
jgi:hypothetical protein